MAAVALVYLGLWGSPFGNAENAGQLVVTTREQLEFNYGHAGPRFVEYLLNNRQIAARWIEWYRELNDATNSVPEITQSPGGWGPRLRLWS